MEITTIEVLEDSIFKDIENKNIVSLLIEDLIDTAEASGFQLALGNIEEAATARYMVERLKLQLIKKVNEIRERNAKSNERTGTTRR